MVPIFFQELEFERIWDLVRSDPRLGFRLESTDDETTDFFLEIGVAVGVTKNRQVRVYTFDGVGDDVEVFRRVQGHIDSGHRTDLLGPLPGAVDDDLGLDIACFSMHTGHPPARGENLEYTDVFDDPRPAHPGSFGQRTGEVGRIGFAVGGQPDRANEVVDAHYRIVLECLFGGEEFTLEIKGRSIGGRAAQLDHPVFGARDCHAPALLVSGRQPDFAFEFGVELGGVLNEPRAAFRGTQLSDEAAACHVVPEDNWPCSSRRMSV